MHRIAAVWLSALQRRPRLVNGVQGGFLGGTGDAIAQRLERRADTEPARVDARRLAGASALGVLFSGFIYPPLYALLEGLWPGTAFRAVAAKACSDVLLLGIFGNATSISGRLLLAGRAPSEVTRSVRETMPSVLVNEVRVWLPYNLLAFRFVPTAVRPTTTAFLSLLWQVYISWTAHASSRPAVLSRAPTQETVLAPAASRPPK
mmetsp:Transcript_16226/g.51768  ORF Transcript_16226/g.51768 Transcript_16226/m.51768 type:complete len:205 (-) Transcript_16226:197-811(-)|eukprot:scaffold16723_cov143-Isochrysis_galbana.AAC.3